MQSGRIFFESRWIGVFDTPWKYHSANANGPSRLGPGAALGPRPALLQDDDSASVLVRLDQASEIMSGGVDSSR